MASSLHAGADGMVSVIAHEAWEAISDPVPGSGWAEEGTGEENADMCSWKYGNTSSLPNGAAYNVQLGSRKFLIQQNWVNQDGGYCGSAIGDNGG